MQRKPAPRKSLNTSLGLIGTLIFMAAALAAIPIIVIVIYAVVYMPFGIALLVIVGYLTRPRWVPGLRRRVQKFLSVPQISPGLKERSEPLHHSPTRLHVATKSETLPETDADLRNVR